MAFNQQLPGSVPATDTEAAILAGVNVAANDTDPETTHFIVVPRGCEVKSLEEFRNAPRRIKETFTTVDVPSFAAYVTKFKTDGTIIVTNAAAVMARSQGSPVDVEFDAYLDYHTPDKPSWGEHTAELRLMRSREWLTWIGVNKRPMNQQQLCEFIEDNMPDIREPESAKLLEMIRQFEVKKEIRFNSAKNLNNGDVQFMYEESSTGTSAKGTVSIPESLTLGIRVFEGMHGYHVPVRLRWKLQDSTLSLWFDVLRASRIERDAIESVIKDLRQALDLPFFQLLNVA